MLRNKLYLKYVLCLLFFIFMIYNRMERLLNYEQLDISKAFDNKQEIILPIYINVDLSV